MFNKHEGRDVQLVVSASRSLLEMPRADVIALALRELAEFLPGGARGEARKSARGEGNPRDVFGAARDWKRGGR